MEITNIQKTAPDGLFRITDIKPAVHSDNRVNIFVNNEYSFSLDITQVVDLGVKVGKLFTFGEIEHLKNASEFGKLYQSTLEWVLARPHSISETRNHLYVKKLRRTSDNKQRERLKKYREEHRDENPYKNPDNLDEDGRLKYKSVTWSTSVKQLPEITDENIEAVLSRLIEKKYLDDEKFVRFYVENRNVKKGISATRMKQELRAKGVDPKIISIVIDESSRSDEEEIKKIIAKKRRKYSDSQLVSYLVRQGFDFQLSQNLVSEKD